MKVYYCTDRSNTSVIYKYRRNAQKFCDDAALDGTHMWFRAMDVVDIQGPDAKDRHIARLEQSLGNIADAIMSCGISRNQKDTPSGYMRASLDTVFARTRNECAMIVQRERQAVHEARRAEGKGCEDWYGDKLKTQGEDRGAGVGEVLEQAVSERERPTRSAISRDGGFAGRRIGPAFPLGSEETPVNESP